MIEKVTLPNGVRLVFEDVPHVRSAALGLWVGRGSRHEPDALSGITHAIEHMVFKGTETRSSAQIAAQMDEIGGQVNAFTTKECTCYYARVLGSHLPQAMDVLCDIFFHPKLDPQDWAVERRVILEEIDMYEDTPEDLVTERLFSHVFAGTPLGRPILGRASTLNKLSAARIRTYMQEQYAPQHIVVSLAGCFTEADREALITRFGEMAPRATADVAPGAFAPSFCIRQKDIEQNHLCLGFPGLSFRDPRRYALQILSSILGGGLSSRLFQSIREKLGLCYSIYSFLTGHEDTGLLGIYTALGPNTEAEALKRLMDIVRDFAAVGPTEEELTRTRRQVTANVLLGLESTAARMNHLGRNELLLNHIPETDEIVEAYDAVTAEDIRTLARGLFDPRHLSFSAVGRVKNADGYRKILC